MFIDQNRKIILHQPKLSNINIKNVLSCEPSRYDKPCLKCWRSRFLINQRNEVAFYFEAIMFYALGQIYKTFILCDLFIMLYIIIH